jgi:hypothetical protein
LTHFILCAFHLDLLLFLLSQILMCWVSLSNFSVPNIQINWYYVRYVEIMNTINGLSWSWSYGSWIYNCLCNQCLSPLKLWVRIPLRQGVLETTLCDKVCQWLPTGQWFSPGTSVSYTNKPDCHDITEILLKVALNTISQAKAELNSELKHCQRVIILFIYYKIHVINFAAFGVVTHWM